SNGRAGPPAHAQSIRHATHGRIGRATLRRDIRIYMKAEGERSKQVRVLVVAAPPDWIGGQAVQAAPPLDGLAREPGVEAELLPIRPRLPGALQLLREIKYVRTVVYTIAYFALLLLRLPRFDVAHVFAASYFSFVIAPAPAVIIAKLYGKPVLLNYHSGEAEDHLRRCPRSTKLIFRLADRVVVPSRYLVGVFARFGIEAEAVSNTAPLERFAFRERRPLRPTLLSNRSLESHYNVADTLRAFALIERRVPDARLIVAGGGGEPTRPRRPAAGQGVETGGRRAARPNAGALRPGGHLRQLFAGGQHAAVVDRSVRLRVGGGQFERGRDPAHRDRRRNRIALSVRRLRGAGRECDQTVGRSKP